MVLIERSLLGCFYAWSLCLKKMCIRVCYKWLRKLDMYECVCYEREETSHYSGRFLKGRVLGF